MIVMITPSGTQFLMTHEEVKRLIHAPVDGVYRFANMALHRILTVTPKKPLTEKRFAWLVGESDGVRGT